VFIIAFASLSLRSLCEDSTHAEAELGETAAQGLRSRFADLRAATSVEDLVAGSPRFLDDKREQLAMELKQGFRMVVSPNHVNNPRDSENRVDWSKVRRVKIVEITK
jgi:hypothetical protein